MKQCIINGHIKTEGKTDAWMFYTQIPITLFLVLKHGREETNIVVYFCATRTAYTLHIVTFEHLALRNNKKLQVFNKHRRRMEGIGDKTSVPPLPPILIFQSCDSAGEPFFDTLPMGAWH